jgi:uncharacterized integral membrane protein
MSKSAIISIISAILLIIFAVQNSEIAALTLFFWEFKMSLALLLLIMFLLGAGFGYFFHIAIVLRKKRAKREQDKLSGEVKTHIQS